MEYASGCGAITLPKASESALVVRFEHIKAIVALRSVWKNQVDAA